MRRLMLAIVVALWSVVWFAPPAMADDDGHPAIVWVGAVATNIFYMPVKVVHAGLGGIIGGLGWLVSGGNPNVANGVFDHTIFTSWYVTPDMLEGKEEFSFFGNEKPDTGSSLGTGASPGT